MSAFTLKDFGRAVRMAAALALAAAIGACAYADPNTQLVAMADAFQDRAEASLKTIRNAHGDRVAVDDCA